MLECLLGKIAVLHTYWCIGMHGYMCTCTEGISPPFEFVSIVLEWIRVLVQKVFPLYYSVC